MERIAFASQCVLCKRVPLDIQHCYACETVICQLCKVVLEEETQEKRIGAGTTSKQKGCPNCPNNPTLQLVKLKNAEVKRVLYQAVHESHCCAGEAAKDGKSS